MQFDNKFRGKSGIYQIKNILNNKIYIGSSNNMYLRFLDHRAELRHNVHSNKHLQNAFNKYGEENFKFTVIQLCDVEILRDTEQWYIDVLKPEYNICESTFLPPSTEDSRKRQSETRKSKFAKGELIPTKAHPIFVYYKTGEFVGKFKTITQAAKCLGIKNADRLADTISGKHYQCKGYKAFNEYQKNLLPFEKPSNKGKTFKSKMYTLVDIYTGESYTTTLKNIGEFVAMKKETLQQYIDKNIKLRKRYYLCRVTK